MPDQEDVNVTQLLTQWLARIETKLDNLMGKLDNKADRAELQALMQRIDHESSRIDGLQLEVEHQSRSKAENTEWKRFSVPIVLTLVMIVLAVIPLVWHK